MCSFPCGAYALTLLRPYSLTCVCVRTPLSPAHSKAESKLNPEPVCPPVSRAHRKAKLVKKAQFLPPPPMLAFNPNPFPFLPRPAICEPDHATASLTSSRRNINVIPSARIPIGCPLRCVFPCAGACVCAMRDCGMCSSTSSLVFFPPSSSLPPCAAGSRARSNRNWRHQQATSRHKLTQSQHAASS